MRLTIEEINGKKYTAIRHKPDFPSLQTCAFRFDVMGCGYLFFGGQNYATILPALPRHPRPEDTPLLCRYVAEGLLLSGRFRGYGQEMNHKNFMHALVDGEEMVTTHAILNNERVEIALI